MFVFFNFLYIFLRERRYTKVYKNITEKIILKDLINRKKHNAEADPTVINFRNKRER